MPTKLKFAAGRNIAMKVPPHAYEPTIQFYRDVLDFQEVTRHPDSVGFEFGSNTLWIDRVPGVSQAETWLEVVANDLAAAAEHLRSAGVVRCDEIEPLPEGFEGFWVSSPASIIHLICKDSESQ